MFKIQLENGEFFKNKSGRVQHYKTTEKADAKIQRLGDVASDAKAVECIAKTKSAEEPVEAVKKSEKSKKAKKSKKSTA